ncbi:hypothetical protein AAVH_33384 [Aphelenchoides avenae]|nr:hypothetical protein AAVH_33384 [Aphelenchus avenae]
MIDNVLADPAMAQAIIEGTGLTVGYVSDVLCNKNPDFRAALHGSKVARITAKDICNGNGYCSFILKTVVEFEDPPREPYAFILKIPNRAGLEAVFGSKKGSKHEQDATTKVVDEMMSGHNVECDFYDQFSDNGVIPVPKVWHTMRIDEQNAAAIFMEYVAGVPQSFLANLSTPQIKTILRCLAGFHAHVLAMDELQWRGKYTRSLHTMDYAETPRATLEKLIAVNPIFKDLGRKLENVIGAKYAQYALIDAPKLLGSLMADVARLYMLSLDAEVRREVEEWTPQFYYDELKEMLSKSGRNVGFGVEEVRTAYKLAAANQATHTINAPFFIDSSVRGKLPYAVCDAIFEKFVLRAKLALHDAVVFVAEVAPSFLTE